jgi:hypothetical protein
MQTTAMLDDNFSTSQQPLTIYSVHPYLQAGNSTNNHIMLVSTPTGSGTGAFRQISSASKATNKGEEMLKYHPSVIGQLKYKEYCKGLFEEQIAN